MPQPLHAYFLGRRPYLPVLELMGSLFEKRRSDTIGDTLLLLEHEPVITMGRGAHAENLLAEQQQLEQIGVSVVETGRGGDVTLHAPGQLIAYPIIDLSPDRRDVRKYVQALTEVMRRLVAAHGIDAGTIDQLIGLWTDTSQIDHWPGEASARTPAKLGAIGVRISRWITQHGFALNLTTDLSLYQLIVPCGISEYPVASIKSLTGQAPSVVATAEKAVIEFNELLGAGEPRWTNCAESPLEEITQLAIAN